MVATPKNNPNIPVSVADIIVDGVACVRAGASILHLHARDEQGYPTYKKEVYAQMIEGIREQCPDVVICASTSGRVHNEFRQRSEVLELTGDAKPDMASLTLGSLNFKDTVSINSVKMVRKLLNKMLEKGVIPELEIFDQNMCTTANILHEEGLLHNYYANLILGTPYSTMATTSNLVHIANQLPPGANWACGAIGANQLPMNTAAIVSGGNVRTGLEDNLYYSYKKLATNTKLVTRIVELCKLLGKEVSSIKETRTLLSL